MELKPNWKEVSRNLAVVAAMADDFLKLSDDEKRAIVAKRGDDRLSVYAGFHLAATIRQAKEMASLLEKAEIAWREARRPTATHQAASPAKPELTTAS